MKQFRLWIGIVFLFLMISSCKTLKPYERIYVNDPEMQIGNETNDFEHYFQSVREGATVPTTKSGNGGCGCN